MRSTILLGIAGVGGLGFEITVSLQSRNWEEVWTLIGVILVFAAMVEFWSNWVRQDLAVFTCSYRGVVQGPARKPPGASALHPGTKLSLALLLPGGAAAWWWVGIEPTGLLSERTQASAGRLLDDLWPPGSPEGGLRALFDASMDTVAMAVLAMVIAVGVTLLLAPWATRPRAERRGSAGWVRRAAWWLTRLVLLALRSVPPTVWAIIALFALFPGVVPGAVALGVYTAGILGKLTAEAWETMDLEPRDALRHAGVSPLVAATTALAPPSLHHLLTYSTNRFEICVRDTAIVGVVGAAGLGRTLAEGLASFDYGVVCSVLLFSLVISVSVDATGRRMRRALRP